MASYLACLPFALVNWLLRIKVQSQILQLLPTIRPKPSTVMLLALHLDPDIDIVPPSLLRIHLFLLRFGNTEISELSLVFLQLHKHDVPINVFFFVKIGLNKLPVQQ